MFRSARSMICPLIAEPVVKFSRAEDLKPIGELLMIRCYLEPEPDAQANAQYYWFDNNGDPITGTNSQQ